MSQRIPLGIGLVALVVEDLALVAVRIDLGDDAAAVVLEVGGHAAAGVDDLDDGVVLVVVVAGDRAVAAGDDGQALERLVLEAVLFDAVLAAGVDAAAFVVVAVQEAVAAAIGEAGQIDGSGRIRSAKRRRRRPANSTKWPLSS
jgi:hypothetical protein